MSEKENRKTGGANLDFHPWAKELGGMVTACDKDGIIISMNEDRSPRLQRSGRRKTHRHEHF